jgi:hypothetical protein
LLSIEIVIVDYLWKFWGVQLQSRDTSLAFSREAK